MITPLLPPTPDAPRHRTYYLKQIVITLVSGVLLGFGSCFALVTTGSFTGQSKQLEAALFIIGFFLGVALVLAAGMLAIVAIIMFFIRAVRGEQ